VPGPVVVPSSRLDLDTPRERLYCKQCGFEGLGHPSSFHHRSSIPSTAFNQREPRWAGTGVGERRIDVSHLSSVGRAQLF